MQTRVFYESWQMECCGDPFEVGDDVTWDAIPVDSQGDEPDVDWVEEHHSDGDEVLTTLEGRVQGIEAVHRRFIETEPGSRTWIPVAGDALMTAIPRADGTGNDRRGDREDGRKLTGYLVTLQLDRASGLPSAT